MLSEHDCSICVGSRSLGVLTVCYGTEGSQVRLQSLVPVFTEAATDGGGYVICVGSTLCSEHAGACFVEHPQLMRCQAQGCLERHSPGCNQLCDQFVEG